MILRKGKVKMEVSRLTHPNGQFDTHCIWLVTE